MHRSMTPMTTFEALLGPLSIILICAGLAILILIFHDDE